MEVEKKKRKNNNKNKSQQQQQIDKAATEDDAPDRVVDGNHVANGKHEGGDVERVSEASTKKLSSEPSAVLYRVALLKTRNKTHFAGKGELGEFLKAIAV